MNFAPVASAVNSRFREIARATRLARIGARIAKRIPRMRRIAFPLPLLSSEPENQRDRRKISAAIEIIPMRTAVSVINRMSKLATCAISWAMTPSSSCLESLLSAPVVTQMTACCGFLPDAKAFICSDSMT